MAKNRQQREAFFKRLKWLENSVNSIDIEDSQLKDKKKKEAIKELLEIGHKSSETVVKIVALFNAHRYRSWEFVLERELFGSAEQFAALKLPQLPEPSFKLNTLHILQELTAYRLEKKNFKALIELELMRLQFVKDSFSEVEGEPLYREALERLYER